MSVTRTWVVPGEPVLAMGLVGELIEWAIIATVLYVLVSFLSRAVPNRRDREWLPRLIMWGFAAKLAGTLARYFMAADLYGGGDAFGYHGRGIAFAGIWRDLSVPMSTAGGEGTAFTEVVTGLLYAIYTPSMRGGFLMFAFVAFLGQLLFYAAFRPWLQGKALKRYAIVVMFLPSIVFWPASVGKDALMIFFTGLATYGISRLLQRIDILGLGLAGLGLYLTAQIRPHIAMMIALAAVLAFVFMKRSTGTSKGVKRLIPLGLALIGVVFAWGVFAEDFQVSLDGTEQTQDPAAFLDRVSAQTAQGGSQVGGGAVTGFADIPAATLKVLFRPLIYEASSAAIFLSAIEGTALLVLFIWKLPAMWRNRRMLRPNPLLLMSFFYSGGFVIAFSSVLNLGIIARQRVQVLPFLLAILVAMGWPPDEEPADQEQPRRPTAVMFPPPSAEPWNSPLSRDGVSENRAWTADPDTRRTGSQLGRFPTSAAPD